jgi:hypothetical protein
VFQAPIDHIPVQKDARTEPQQVGLPFEICVFEGQSIQFQNKVGMGIVIAEEVIKGAISLGGYEIFDPF